MEDTRNYNVGASDYSKHSIQPWDIWIDYVLNPFDADLVKRLLRKKSTDSRKLDYEKMIHISKERIRQIEECDVFSYKERKHKFSITDICKCYDLSLLDCRILSLILLMEFYSNDEKILMYNEIIKGCEEGIEEENNKEKLFKLQNKIHDENYLSNAIENTIDKITDCIMENKK